MKLSEYQKFCLTTAVYPRIGSNWKYPLIGLGGEVGELMNDLKKSIRDDNNKITEEKRVNCSDELGDIAWYFVMICYELKIDPDLVLERNVFKLQNRKKNNTIHDKGRNE